MNDFRRHFPLLFNKRWIHYLDSAATSQKPIQIADSISHLYKDHYAPVHRSQYELADITTFEYEQARKDVAEFINAKSEHEIAFTKNTNESINIIANTLKNILTERDILILSKSEHHANIVPWLQIQKEERFEIRYLDIDNDYHLMWEQIERWSRSDKDRIKAVSLAHASNVTGSIYPIKEIISFIKQQCPNQHIWFTVDGAQAVPHFKVDVQDLDCDYYAFSAHKMLGPAGVGVLYASDGLSGMEPLIYGSHMINEVTEKEFSVAYDEVGLEAGTPNIEGVIGFRAAISILNDFGMEEIEKHEQKITRRALRQLQQIEGLILYGSNDQESRLGIFTFNIKGVHSHDVAQILGNNGVLVRAGDFCCQPLMQRLNIPGAVRASTYLYTIEEDIDALIEGIHKVKSIFKV